MDDRNTLIQKIKTYKGILQKQNKIINAMAEQLADDDFCPKEKCYASDKACEQCVREYFEGKV
ncbi:MAG: hypothetical protein ACLU84_06795 [Clostridia bacterium]